MGCLVKFSVLFAVAIFACLASGHLYLVDDAGYLRLILPKHATELTALYDMTAQNKRENWHQSNPVADINPTGPNGMIVSNTTRKLTKKVQPDYITQQNKMYLEKFDTKDFWKYVRDCRLFGC